MLILKLRKLLSLIKHYWYIPLIVVGIIVSFVVFRKRPDGLVNVLKKTIESHQKEVDILEDTRKEEIEKRNRALSLYEATISQIETKYEEQQKSLDNKKKKEIEKIIKENKDDPEELAKRISNFTGFKIVLPED